MSAEQLESERQQRECRADKTDVGDDTGSLPESRPDWFQLQQRLMNNEKISGIYCQGRAADQGAWNGETTEEPAMMPNV